MFLKNCKNSAIRLTLFLAIALYRHLLFPLRGLLKILLDALAWRIGRRERRLAVAQLQTRLGVGHAQAREIARANCRHLAQSVVEALELDRRPKKILARVRLDPACKQRLDAALSSGRGLVFATGHIGNWELMAAKLAATYPTATVVKGSYDPKLAAWIDRFRRRYGIVTVARDDAQAAERLKALLEGGYIVGVLIDQNTRVKSAPVPFFGADAPTPVGAAALSLKHDVPLFAGWTHRLGLAHTVFAEPVTLDPARVYKQRPSVALTALATAKLEAAIKTRPDQWVWFHKRWG